MFTAHIGTVNGQIIMLSFVSGFTAATAAAVKMKSDEKIVNLMRMSWMLVVLCWFFTKYGEKKEKEF